MSTLGQAILDVLRTNKPRSLTLEEAGEFYAEFEREIAEPILRIRSEQIQAHVYARNAYLLMR